MALKPLLYNNDHAGSISYLVYIGGLEIPSMGFEWSNGVWEIPQAQVRLVPDPLLHRLGAEDRLPVQCFYLDQWQHSPPQYCLAFDGEIVAWGVQSTPGGAAMTFTCVDYIAILTHTFFFLMSTFDDFAVGTSSASIGVSANGVQTAGFGALYPYSLFAQGIANPDDVDDDRLIERPIDYAYNIVRALIKLTQPNRSVPAANFFAPWAKKSQFHKRWVATPYFDADPQDPHAPGLFPILKAVQDTHAIDAIARQAAQAANGSLWSMLQEVLRTVMCELSMLSTPSAVKSDYRTMLPQGKPTTYSAGAEPVFLTQYFVKPQSYYSLPPTCNVFFPSQIQQGAYQENFATQPTRAYYNEATITNILSNHAGDTGAGAAGRAALMQDAMTTGYPEEVDIAVRDARDAALQNGKNMLVYPEEYFKGPVILRKQLPRWFAYLIDATRGTLEQSGTSTEGDDVGGAAGLNNASQYSQTEVGPIYFGGMRNPGANFLTNMGITSFTLASGFNAGRPTDAQILLIKQASLSRAGGPGECVPPQIFPVRPATAWKGYSGRGNAGGFWSVRGGGIHGGHDLNAPLHTDVVAATAGTIIDIVSCGLTRENRNKGKPLEYGPGKIASHASEELGNCVIIRDEKRGTHRYMHLYELAAGIQIGKTVTAGEHIGYVGSTGQSGAHHLHYDVTDSKGKFRMPYPHRLAMLARHPGATTAPPAPAPSPSSGTPAQSGAQNAALNPNTSANGGTGDTGSVIASGDTTRNLFKRYAKCDYFTERYSQRNGTLSMPFNPYPIPGFGMAAFDRSRKMLDTVGYLTNVQHSISAFGWSTTVTYSQGRTFQEMFALMQRDAALDTARGASDNLAISSTIDRRYAAAEARINALIAANPNKTRAVQDERYRSGVVPDLEWISPASTEPVPGAAAAPPSAAPAPASTGTGTTSTGNPTGTPTDVDAELAGYPAPVGDVRMAPAEPLEEVRQLQDIEIANAFYMAMFWQLERGDQLGISDLNAEDALSAGRERERSGRASFLTAEQVREAGPDINNAVVDQALSGPTGEAAARQRNANAAARAAARTPFGSSAVFRQEDIIRMVTRDAETGESETLDIENSGVSSMTRTKALRLIRKAFEHPGEMTQVEMQQLADLSQGVGSTDTISFDELSYILPSSTPAQGRVLAPGQTWSYVPCPADQLRLLQFLRAQERRWWTQTVTTNVRGDVAIVPTAAAADLWESFTLAQKYNARPVCTLDEYRFFLGEDAPGGEHNDTEEGALAVHPGPTNLGPNNYTHPAKYYRVLRHYDEGPPLDRARTLLTGSAVGGSGLPTSATPAQPGTPVNPVTPPPPAPATPAATPSGSSATTPRSFPAAASNPDAAVRALASGWTGDMYDDLSSSWGGPSQSDKDRIDAILMSFLVDNDDRIRGMNPAVSRAEATSLASRVRTQLLRRNAAGHNEFLVPRSVGAPFLAAFARTQTFAVRLSDNRGETRDAADYVRAYIAEQNPTGAFQAQQQQQIQSAHEQRLADSRQVVGTHTVEAQYIAGVPASFPETRATWSAVLEQYRKNVLERLDPRG